MSKRKLSGVATSLISNVSPTNTTKPYELKIVTWNVAGFKACLKKGLEDYVLSENPDIICFQETKCPEFPPYSNTQRTIVESKLNYFYYWITNSKPGYCGVSTWSKIKPLSVIEGIEDGNTQQGRVLTLEFENFYLINAYVVNSGEKLVNLATRRKFNEDFAKFLKKLDAIKTVILCGDLNVAHKSVDLENPSTNLRTAGYTVEEREDFTRLLSQGFTDTYRRLYPETKKVYTFWSYRANSRANNVGWRIDYGLISDRKAENLVEYIVRADVLGSDHCPSVLFYKQ